MTQAAIRQSLANCKTIAVVGLSPKPHRDSFRVAKYMQEHGFRIVPINPNATEVLGEKAYASLTEAATHERIDMVNCFRNSEDIPPIAAEAIAIGAKSLWLQIGVVNDAAAKQATNAGLVVVQDLCLMVEHRQLN
ncbi:MAG: CoA-binding protein [Burkholderiales bacterium 35-55-47]|jgi:predicted CoA-binding protein|uniref:CoA-binding protein n=1 Tax=Limnohabitans sp. TaxID=1907725 RepID=UPI000BD21239|nr:CoA-binding protein [Limnohabitans sp.]OYY17383.1 MAG: CoA-binding protein [Burkholderiales bacterium 35-55-47]OYZ71951.1 MAG: CoA-binding protein [Burkholderiales bacterium 24-55-52]OZA98968.1 MAG: CoA-binding protein [Burkholderiales bacterium 39-55-53]HQR87638.1 CoA-binding protein [Limnohabitans sp.]HQS28102.1 CoA-binding protein [Limnohabitans sp.]